jgi:hypothetical protein
VYAISYLQLKLREMWGTGELQQLLMMARETTWTFDLVGVGHAYLEISLIPSLKANCCSCTGGGAPQSSCSATAAATTV